MCPCGAEIRLTEVTLGRNLSPSMTMQQFCIISVPYIGTLVLFLGLLLLKSSPPYHRIKGFLRCTCVWVHVHVCSWICTNTLKIPYLKSLSVPHLTYIHRFVLLEVSAFTHKLQISANRNAYLPHWSSVYGKCIWPVVH